MSRKWRVMSDINVTPFVDVMLVLLVIFMVTAPMIQQGLEVELPKTQAEGLPSDDDPLIVSVKRDGSVHVERAAIPLSDLESKLKKIFLTRDQKRVFLRADARVNYGTVAKTLAILQRAGATRIGMVTEPEV